MNPDFLESDLYNYNAVNSLNNSGINKQYFIDNDYSCISYEDLYEIRKENLFGASLKSFDRLNFFTISSKDDFSDLVSNTNNKIWKSNLYFDPLNDHSRTFLEKGDLLFCNRIGQFDNLSSALNTRGIYAIGIALKDPELIDINGSSSDYKNYKIEVGFPCVLNKHLSTRNIQQHPNTIDLTPYNGNRNDALQWIQNKEKAISLLEMLNVENEYVKIFLKIFFDYDLKKISALPTEVLNTIYQNKYTSNNKYPLNKILTGPAGTGKTYHSIQHAVEIIDGYYHTDRTILKSRYDKLIANGRIDFVTFHQGFSYEEFIEGIRVITDEKSNTVKYSIEDGIFKKISDRAKENRDKNYVLIIDEINRGNISKIFGELITLIEESKRLNNDESLELRLPYSQKIFGVPNNLYILGTMNSSDRSLTSLDIALRRRFEFEELYSDTKLLENIEIEGIDVEKLFNTINKRISLLIGRDYCIGHAYFIKLRIERNRNINYLAEIFEYKIIPLLQEYFYDDWEAISIIFGGNQFIYQEITIDEIKGLIGTEHTHIDIWKIGKENLRDKSQYLKIYQE